MLENIHEAKLLQPITALHGVTWQWRDNVHFLCRNCCWLSFTVF